MPLITLTTTIDAPIERCFDLARSIDLHTTSTAQTSERAVAGVTSGLIGEGEEVTWRARHFGIMQHLTSRIESLERPRYFVDRMQRGAFKSMVHRHIFEPRGAGTLMRDELEFEAPLGFLGRIFSALVLTGYMRRFLRSRNAVLKSVAESDRWNEYLA
jgi:ligand-binding SRPBCC domain-containing protein